MSFHREKVNHGSKEQTKLDKIEMVCSLRRLFLTKTFFLPLSLSLNRLRSQPIQLEYLQ